MQEVAPLGNRLKVATIMSIYRNDNAASLERALGSIAEQIFTEPVESRLYIAVDGPVPQALEDVIARWQGKIYHLHRIQHNIVLAAALNLLIASLQDEDLVFRMDADDFSRADRYQKQIDHLRRHPEIDILGSDILEIDQQSGARRLVSFNGTPGNALFELCKRVPVAHPTVCFRRKVLDQVQAYPVNRGNEDIAMWFRCVREGFSFGNIHEPLLEFSISNDFWKRRGFRKAWTEFRCYAVGIWSVHGLTWRFIYPLSRLALRLAPAFLARKAYESGLRAPGKSKA